MNGGGINTSIISSYTIGTTGIVAVINVYLVPTIFTLALLVFLWGVAKAYILKGTSEPERSKGHQLILWGVVGFAVMLSVWGLVNLLQASLGLSGPSRSPKPPCVSVSSSNC